MLPHHLLRICSGVARENPAAPGEQRQTLSNAILSNNFNKSSRFADGISPCSLRRKNLNTLQNVVGTDSLLQTLLELVCDKLL